MCKCIDRLNANLSEHNTQLVTTLFSSWALLWTMKKDPKKRGKPAAVAATFCPFCGNKYPRSDKVAT